MKRLKILTIMALIFTLAGCAAKTPSESFVPSDLSGKLGQGYRQKVDNAMFILDASTSMFEKHPFSILKPFEGEQKFILARDVLLNTSTSISALKLQAGLHIFGPPLGKDNSTLIYGPVSHKTTEFAAAANSVDMGGLTPLAQPLVKSIGDLQSSKGKIAVIIASDGIKTADLPVTPTEAAEQLKNTYGDRLCIYTILIGDDPVGRQALKDIATAGSCGFATVEAALSTTAGMTDFVERVFLEKVPPKPVVKKEPPPPPPKPVVKKEPPPPPPKEYEVLTMNLYVEFDFDKETIRPREEDELDEFALFMRTHATTWATLEGHTDNYGTKEYNNDLSERRAKSVKRYLVKNFGLVQSRLKTVGYGQSRPMTTNKTESGRQSNRRVMAIISATVEK